MRFPLFLATLAIAVAGSVAAGILAGFGAVAVILFAVATWLMVQAAYLGLVVLMSRETETCDEADDDCKAANARVQGVSPPRDM